MDAEPSPETMTAMDHGGRIGPAAGAAGPKRSDQGGAEALLSTVEQLHRLRSHLWMQDEFATGLLNSKIQQKSERDDSLVCPPCNSLGSLGCD